MELPINQFWILKGDSMINSVNEYGPDVLNTFAQYDIKNYTKNVSAH